MRAPTLILAATLFAACSPAADMPVAVANTGPALAGPVPTLTTDNASYVVSSDSSAGTMRQYSFRVVATISNTSSQQLYVDACGAPAPAYGIISETGQSAYSQLYACAGGLLGLSLPAHSSRTDTLVIRGPELLDRTGAVIGDLSGSAHLVYTVGTCRSLDGCRATEAATSNVFNVVRP